MIVTVTMDGNHAYAIIIIIIRRARIAEPAISVDFIDKSLPPRGNASTM